MMPEGESIIINIIANIKGFQAGIRNAEKSIEGFSAKAFRAGQKLKKWASTFSGWALSIMFFGMLIQRTFLNIGKTVIKTFKDITTAQSVQSQALAKLEAAWTFLKYTIGNAIALALAPLVPIIVNIIKTIADWINAHPKLTAWIIILAAVVGTVLFVVGSLVLGIKGLIELFLILVSNLVIIQFFISIIVVILTIIGIMKIWRNKTIDTVDKIVGTIGTLAAAILVIALLFGLWPVALIAAIVLSIAALVIMRKRIFKTLEGIKLWFDILSLDIQEAFVKAFIFIEKFVREKINVLIRLIKSSLGKFAPKGLKEVSEQPLLGKTMLGIVDEQIKEKMNRLYELQKEYDALGEPGTEFKELFFGDMKSSFDELGTGTADSVQDALGDVDFNELTNGINQSLEDIDLEAYPSSGNQTNIDTVNVTVDVPSGGDAGEFFDSFRRELERRTNIGG